MRVSCSVLILGSGNSDLQFSLKMSWKKAGSTSKEGADMPTAFFATYDSGKPVIGIMGEFDALACLSRVLLEAGSRNGKRLDTAAPKNHRRIV